ncbi:YbaN family protein [Devosia albogilva]|uniref:YbaN family protein n=1 Tax=Devosia albogilva TaxID=429726 RepID=A0ABW5QEY6_9HYPH
MIGTVRGPLLTTAGLFLLALGGAGIVLPVLPTTPFFIAAAACFSRSSPRFEHWLVNHPALGQPVRAWRDSRAIPLQAKIVAIIAMSCSFAALLIAGSPHPVLPVIVGATLAACAVFILSRPTQPSSPSSLPPTPPTSPAPATTSTAACCFRESLAKD